MEAYCLCCLRLCCHGVLDDTHMYSRCDMVGCSRFIFVDYFLEGRSGTWHRCFSWFGELLWFDLLRWVVVCEH